MSLIEIFQLHKSNPAFQFCENYTKRKLGFFLFIEPSNKFIRQDKFDGIKDNVSGKNLGLGNN